MHVLPQPVSGACIGHSRSSVATRLVLQVLIFTDVFADTADLTGLNGIKPGAPAQGGRTAVRAGRAGPHVERWCAQKDGIAARGKAPQCTSTMFLTVGSIFTFAIDIYIDIYIPLLALSFPFPSKFSCVMKFSCVSTFRCVTKFSCVMIFSCVSTLSFVL